MIIIIIIIIKLISIFKDDNVLSMTANLQYGPPVNKDIDYYRTFFIFVSVAKLFVQYFVRKREAIFCLKMLSAKQGSH